MTGRSIAAAVTAAVAVAGTLLAALAPGARAAPASPAPGGLSAFRVDVSQYPQVGLVVTLRGGGHPGTSGAAPVSLAGLPATNFSVSAGRQALTPQVRQLSPADVELAVAPDGGLPAPAVAAERAATESFLAGLPTGERTVAILPDHPGILTGTLDGDPAPALLALAGVTTGERGDAAARLSTALSAFTSGPRVRRTVVLAVTRRPRLTQTQASLFARRLAASGTALYVLDAAPGGAPGLDALATHSGGFAAPVRGTTGWATAFGQIDTDLAQQYYLRFTDPRALPGQLKISVGTVPGVLAGTVDLPVHNPIAPPQPSPAPAAPVPARTGAVWDTSLVLLATALIVIGVGYGLSMLAASRRDPRRRRRRRGALPPPGGARPDLFFVFLMPCLNEATVIANSLQRLLALPGSNYVVLVIDDGSDDNTADVVTGMGDGRLLLLSRRQPQARQGKGKALNAGFRYLLTSGFLDDRDPDQVIAVVVDADGRLDPGALGQVTPLFSDPAVGAVQIGVRINNRFRSMLARMQDMEFVIYTEVFQRGRRHIGSVGLGGNGQFMRLSAMLSLGTDPWGSGLAEDLDMGIRLIAAGWRNEYCSAVAVHQQGVEQLGRLIRQRSRWFQGHLQSWKNIPLVLRRVRGPARADLLYHMTSPVLLLIASLLSASFLVSLANAAYEGVEGQNPAGWWLATTYALTFGPGLAFSAVYWSKERGEGLTVLRAIGLAHLYVCYGMMWYAAGWWGISRTLRGRTSWAKTDRVAEAPVAGVPAPARAAALAAPAGAGAGPAVPVALAVPAGPGGGPAIPAAPAVPAGTAASWVTVATGPPAATDPVLSDQGTGGDGPGDEGEPGWARRRRARTWRRAIGLTAALAVAAGAALVADTAPQGAPGNRDWLTAFNGYGSTTVTGSGNSLAVSVAPERAAASAQSHAALVVTARTYGDFAATLRLRTQEQLRTGAAGSPRPWEVAWVLWHYTSNKRFYALTLEANGWELSKQDPSYRGGERFLVSGLLPRFPPGTAYTVGVIQVGNQITVSANGRQLARYTDTSRPYQSGAVGLYAEDARATFDHIRIGQLSIGGS